MAKNFLVLLSFGICPALAFAQYVGIGTATPSAMLHIKDGSLLATAPVQNPVNLLPTPATGTGKRMMWYAEKAAFRVGLAQLDWWDKDNIGEYSFATGEGTMAYGMASFAAGSFSKAIGESSIAIGKYAVAAINTAISLGTNTYAGGLYSTALGKDSRAIGWASTVLGLENTSLAFASVVMGRYNDSIVGSNTTGWVLNDPLFIIGNGSSDVARSNALMVLKNGKTAIGDIIPESQLHLANGPNDWTRHIRLQGADGYGVVQYDGDMKFRNFTDGDAFIFRNHNNTSTATLTSTGALTIAGTLTQNSDARLKKNITSIVNPMPTLLQLNGYHYHWKDDWRENDMQIGLLAQEVEKVMPELVTEDDNGIKSVNYIGLLPYLLEAIKELKAEVDALKKK